MNAIIQHSVLIVSGTQKGAAYITELLSPREFAPMTTALSGGDARRQFLDHQLPGAARHFLEVVAGADAQAAASALVGVGDLGRSERGRALRDLGGGEL